MVNYKVVISVFMILSSCNCGDEELQLQRMDYKGPELRTDGYYINEFDSGGESRFTNYFLYRNGIILYGRSPSNSELLELEDKYRNGDFYSEVKDFKSGWGVFKIFGDEIEFERWYSDIPLMTFVRAGTILNDTTFHITRLFKPDGSDESVLDELYHFKAFSPKPDSTNMFIP